MALDSCAERTPAPESDVGAGGRVQEFRDLLRRVGEIGAQSLSRNRVAWGRQAAEGAGRPGPRGARIRVEKRRTRRAAYSLGGQNRRYRYCPRKESRVFLKHGAPSRAAFSPATIRPWRVVGPGLRD